MIKSSLVDGDEPLIHQELIGVHSPAASSLCWPGMHNVLATPWGAMFFSARGRWSYLLVDFTL